MILLNTLKAGVVALALAGTALAAVPAQAASPTFGFQLNLGGGGGSNGGIFLHFGDDDYFDSWALTIKRGAIDLDDAGNYHLMMDYHLVRDGDAFDDSFDGYGTYEINGNRIELTRGDGESGGNGTVQSGKVTIQMNMVAEGDVVPYVFRK